MSIPSHTLEQLNSQANLVEIIGKHTNLKKAGREYKGCCPFHGEKTPSFYVNPQKNVYNCFGCNVGGNAFTFLQEFENRTFMEAAVELSRQTGIEIPKDNDENIRYQRKRLTSQVSNRANANNNNQNNNPQNIPNSHSLNSADSVTAPVPAQNTDSNSPNSDSGYDRNNGNATPISYDGSAIHGDSDINDSHYNHYANLPPPAEFYNQPFEASLPASDGMPNAEQFQSYSSYEGYQGYEGDEGNADEGNLYDLLSSVCKFYQHNLKNFPNAMAYFKQRGLTDETIDTFTLGYAPTGWQHLETAFASDIEGLKLLGLIRTSESGRDYDLLRDRVIFPIRDSRGRVIGFAGRALDNEVKPKYINSSESPVFHKQNILYGYYESRQHRANDWLVVEGYMDVIALYQAGIYGAVASMGTAVNEAQITRLLQYNPTLTLSFDGDSAGQAAAWRTLEISLPVLDDGKSLQFLTLPNGHDPDTFINENGVEAMRRQIEQAVPLSQYVFAYLSERHNLSLPEGKAKLMSQVRSLTANLPKGSSFRYILNSDIYQRLGGKRNQKTAAHDALLDFDSDITISVQLELCLLFDPHLLADDPIQAIWARCEMDSVPMPKGLIKPTTESANNQVNSTPNKNQLPALPSWDSFADTRLIELVQTITKLLPAIPKDINLSAHFILANLTSSRRQQLANRWQGFYQNLTERGIIDVSDLVDDLLVKLLEQALTQQIRQCKGIKVTAYISKQRTQLLNWYKEHQAQSATKDASSTSSTNSNMASQVNKDINAVAVVGTIADPITQDNGSTPSSHNSTSESNMNDYPDESGQMDVFATHHTQ